MAAHWWRRGKPRREEDDLRLYSASGEELDHWLDRMEDREEEKPSYTMTSSRGGRGTRERDAAVLQSRDGPLWWEEAHQSVT